MSAGRHCVDCGDGPLAPSSRNRPASTPRRLTHAGRGLCVKCRERHDRAGTLDLFPKRYWPRAELMEEVEHLGVPDGEAARRLGVSADAIRLARQRVAADREREGCAV